MFIGLSTRGLGAGVSGASGAFAAITALLQGMVVPVLYLLGAAGWGRILAGLVYRTQRHRTVGPDDRPPLWGHNASRHWIQLALGLGFMLLLSHLMGIAGLLTGNSHATLLAGWTPAVIGLVMLADQVTRGSLRPEAWPIAPTWIALCAPGIAVMFIAACSPPGWLWESEFGAYDVMSYHLQLPKEWATPSPLGVGSIWPVDHNVYSFLPSYLEAACLHLGAMTPRAVTMGTGQGLSASERLIGGEGIWILSCQFLHALIGLACAGLVGRTVVVMVGERAGEVGQRSHSQADDARSRRTSSATIAGFVAAAACVCLPWFVVVGSLAYNELAMLAAFAGAMLACVEPGIGRVARGAAVGFLVGIACSVKLTALMLVAPVAGLFLLACLPRRDWLAAILAGSIAGIVAMLPWLIRNAAACGNPVFPFAAGIFGGGHWSAEQLATYLHNHAPDVPLSGRLSLLFSTHGGANRTEARGLLHDQWAWTPAVTMATLLAGLPPARTRRWSFLLMLSLAGQAASWMLFTHLQSRFLLPMLVPMGLGIGVGAFAVLEHAREKGVRVAPEGERGHRRASGLVSNAGALLTRVLLALVPLSSGAWTIMVFLTQRSANPNAQLLAGPGVMTGCVLESSLLNLPPGERQRVLAEQVGPEALINLSLHPGLVMQAEPGAGASRSERVYLLGDGAPLYLLDATGGEGDAAQTDGRGAPVIYHTAWDRSPLGDAIRAGRLDNHDDPRAWTDLLMRQGIGYVLINLPELDRLIVKSGYYDRDVTIERIQRWLQPGSGVVLIRAWPEQGRMLYRLEQHERDTRGDSRQPYGASSR